MKGPDNDRLVRGEMVEPASKVDRVADEIDKERDLVGWPADEESAAHHQWRDCSVASDRDGHICGSRIHLNVKFYPPIFTVSELCIHTCFSASLPTGNIALSDRPWAYSPVCRREYPGQSLLLAIWPWHQQIWLCHFGLPSIISSAIIAGNLQGKWHPFPVIHKLLFSKFTNECSVIRNIYFNPEKPSLKITPTMSAISSCDRKH